MKVELSKEEIKLIRYCSVMDSMMWTSKGFEEKRKSKPCVSDIKSYKQLAKESSVLHAKFIELSKVVE